MILCPHTFKKWGNMTLTPRDQHELNSVNNWLTSNRICINAEKTKYMISYRKLLHLTNITIGSATISIQRKLIILKYWKIILSV